MLTCTLTHAVNATNNVIRSTVYINDKGISIKHESRSVINCIEVRQSHLTHQEGTMYRGTPTVRGEESDRRPCSP